MDLLSMFLFAVVAIIVYRFIVGLFKDKSSTPSRVSSELGDYAVLSLTSANLAQVKTIHEEFGEDIAKLQALKSTLVGGVK